MKKIILSFVEESNYTDSRYGSPGNKFIFEWTLSSNIAKISLKFYEKVFFPLYKNKIYELFLNEPLIPKASQTSEEETPV